MKEEKNLRLFSRAIMSAIAASFKAAALGTAQGVASLTQAAGRSVEVAGKTADKAVEVTGVVAEKSLNVTKKGVEVGANVTMASLNAAGTVSKAGLQTAAVATQAAANISQAAARSTANASKATLEASAKIVASGADSAALVADAAFKGTTQVTTDTLKETADVASAAAKASIGTVTSALNGITRLREITSMKGQNFYNSIKTKTEQGRKVANVKKPQMIIDILVNDFTSVADDLIISFRQTTSSNKAALKVLSANIKDLYCMSAWRRLTKKTCPTSTNVRKGTEQRLLLQSDELDKRVTYFLQDLSVKKSTTITTFKTGSQKIIREQKDEELQNQMIKDFFAEKLDDFSGYVAKNLNQITQLFDLRSTQYNMAIEKAYASEFTMIGVSGGRSRKQKKKSKQPKKTRKQ
jgi:hypothetical protein